MPECVTVEALTLREKSKEKKNFFQLNSELRKGP